MTGIIGMCHHIQLRKLNASRAYLPHYSEIKTQGAGHREGRREREMVTHTCKSQDLRKLRSEELNLEASLSYRVRLS